MFLKVNSLHHITILIKNIYILYSKKLQKIIILLIRLSNNFFNCVHFLNKLDY